MRSDLVTEEYVDGRWVPVYNGEKGTPGWATLKDGRHVYFGEDGNVHKGKDSVDTYKKDVKSSKGDRNGKVKGGRSVGSKSAADATGVGQDGGRVAGKVGRSGDAGSGESRKGEDQSVDKKASRTVKKSDLDAVTDRIDRYAKVFKAKGDDDAAEWMGMLKDHINEHGVDHALEALGEQRTGGHQGKVQYEGASDEVGYSKEESEFIHKYLQKAGVILVHGDTAVDPSVPLVSSWSESNLKQQGRDRSGVDRTKEGNYIPTEATFKHKLEETQHLPGLESTADINDAVGSKVTHFTPEVMKTLDAKYGKGQWIVKSYGDEAYAGFGVFFPQRVKQIQSNAKEMVAEAADKLKDKGYKIARDESNTAIGIAPASGDSNGKVVHFGSKEFDALPDRVRALGGQVRQFSSSENGAMLPTSPEDSLRNNYGITFRRNKKGEPDGVIDRNGRAYDLGSKHVEKLEELDEGDMGHELHRALDADEWRRKEGFSAEPKFMVGPAFKAAGVSAADRAAGYTWETSNEGRVHCITRDGKASVVPYATLAGRADSMPAVFATKDVKDMEKAVEDAINKLPPSERSGQMYAPDVTKTKDGWKVLELNPAAAGGGSLWLSDNPFVIDAVASHVVGREPLHARFIRDVIEKATGKTGKTAATVKEKDMTKPVNGTPAPTPPVEEALPKLNPGLDQPVPIVKIKGGGKSKKNDDVAQNSWEPLATNMAEDQPRDDHGRWSSIGAIGAVRKIKYGSSSVKFSRRSDKKIDGPNLKLNNYRQHDEHSCSFVAALTVAHHFDDTVHPRDVLKAVRPTKSGGLDGASIRKGLAKLGIDAQYKDNLTLAKLRKHVAAGTPVMITVQPKDWSSDHWTVVQGFSDGGNKIHLSNHKSMTIEQFKEEWYDKGEGLVCKKKPPTSNYSRWEAAVRNETGSFFSRCKRDDKGHCLTGDEHGQGREKDDSRAGRRDEGKAQDHGRQVAEEAGKPGDTAAGQERDAVGQPVGAPAAPAVSMRGSQVIPATTEEAVAKIDRYEQFFRDRDEHQMADWMSQLRDHVENVGSEESLKSLGEEIKGRSEKEEVQYAGHSLEGSHDADFVEAYLDRNGISLVHGHAPEGDQRAISTVSPSSDEEGTKSRGDERDVFPSLQALKNKLEEAQHLPGLEKSEDMGKLMGQKMGSEVHGFTPEVIDKLDKTYGKNQWIVKSYGDEAYAGYGVFFPQRVEQLHQDAKNAIWNAGQEIDKHGFSFLRDEYGGIAGIKHKSGEEYEYGTDKYMNTIHGDVRKHADHVVTTRQLWDPSNNKHMEMPSPADSEFGAAIPEGSFMAQPAFPVVGISNEERAQGVTFKKGQEGRVHITTKDGRAEIVPHSTWLKNEHLPVVFESNDTKAMAKAALEAINALPESERKGQLYAPDIVRTKDGFKVVEANPANEAGASGYLQSNPLIIDSYVSHVTGREPAHVRFIRKLLTKKKKTTENRWIRGWEQAETDIVGNGMFSTIKSFFGRCKRDEKGHCVADEQATQINKPQSLKDSHRGSDQRSFQEVGKNLSGIVPGFSSKSDVQLRSELHELSEEKLASVGRYAEEGAKHAKAMGYDKGVQIMDNLKSLVESKQKMNNAVLPFASVAAEDEPDPVEMEMRGQLKVGKGKSLHTKKNKQNYEKGVPLDWEHRHEWDWEVEPVLHEKKPAVNSETSEASVKLAWSEF